MTKQKVTRMTLRQKALAKSILNRNLIETGEGISRASQALALGATVTVREVNWMMDLR